MRVAIFGGGSIGTRHAANARAMGHVVTVYDELPGRGEHPDRFAGADAVLICTPAATHRMTAWHVRDRGHEGPLFVEKPIDVASDAEIFRDWPHPVQMVGYNWRFHPDVGILHPAMPQIASLHFDCRTYFKLWPGKDYAHPLLECSHEIDLARAFLGPPSSVFAGSLLDGGAFVQMSHPGGDSLVDILWNDPAPRRTVRAHRRAGRALLLQEFLTLRPSLGEGLDESYCAELRHFFACIEDDRIPECTFSDGLAVVAIVEQAQRMAA